MNDYPLSAPVGRGLHSYHNYSRTHYGPLRVREALGNSLNIPAVRAIQFVGVANFLDCLRALEIRSLQQHPDFYGDGLALGNGEITLLELVRAYTVLARQGIYRPLACFDDRRIPAAGNPPDIFGRNRLVDRQHPVGSPGPPAGIRQRQPAAVSGSNGG